MVWTKKPFRGYECALIELLGFSKLALKVRKCGKTIYGDSDVRVIGSEIPFFDCQRSNAKTLGLFIVCLRPVQVTQVLDTRCDTHVVRAVGGFQNAQGAPVQQLGV